MLDLFWRQEPDVELSDGNPAHIAKAFDLYYDFDYDLGVRDMEDIRHHLKTLPECNGEVGAAGYCLGGKLCYLMCCRTDIDCAVAYYGTYIEHNIREAPNLHRPFMLHMAMKDRWVQAEVNDLLAAPARRPTRSVEIHPVSRGADHAPLPATAVRPYSTLTGRSGRSAALARFLQKSSAAGQAVADGD